MATAARWRRLTFGGLFGSAVEVTPGGKAPLRVSQLGIEVAAGNTAEALVSQVALEVLDSRSADARVSQVVVEVMDRQPAEVRVSQTIVEVLFKPHPTGPPIFPFPGWSTCPPQDPVVTPGDGDGGTGSFGWPPDPISAIFAVSPDHDVAVDGVNLVDGYSGRYSAPGRADVVIHYGKPAPVDGFISILLPPLPDDVTFTLTIETEGPGGETDSPASDPFLTVPPQP